MLSGSQRPGESLSASVERYARDVTGSPQAAARSLAELAEVTRDWHLNPDRRKDRVRLFKTLHEIAMRQAGGGGAGLKPLLTLKEREGFSVQELLEISRLTPVAIARALRQHARAGSKRVFVIEDELILAEQLRELLETSGFSVLGCAATEASAIAKMRGRDLDLIIADVSLRDRTSGIVAANRIRGDRDIPVIYLTANAHLIRPFSVSRRDCVLEKPLDARAVVSAVKASFSGKAAVSSWTAGF